MAELPAADFLRDELEAFTRKLDERYPYFIGFPAATDFNYTALYPLLGYLLNNVGDPFDDPRHANHSKQIECEVITFFADLFRAPVDDRWGYVTNGGTEGNLYALYVARAMYPDALVYYSRAAHYSVPKAIHILGMESKRVETLPTGEVDYADLKTQITNNRQRPAVVVANIGTTMTEAKDNVRTIRAILKEAEITQSFIHSDAALAGVYTALLKPHHPFDLADGADSISVSGHKFVGSPMPCGIVVTRRSYCDAVARSGLYAGTMDTTISGSRNGHTPVFLWYALKRFGVEGLKRRAEQGLSLAVYAHARLRNTQLQAWRNPNSLTVVFKTPPMELAAKWQLATYDGVSHLVCMPGVTRQRLDAFIADLDR